MGWGTGGTGAFGELCVPLKKYGLRPWEVCRSSRGQTYTSRVRAIKVFVLSGFPYNAVYPLQINILSCLSEQRDLSVINGFLQSRLPPTTL